MSGFLAVVDFNNLLNKDDFLEYFYKIQHRGIDFSNYKVYFDRNNTVFFGHHRLSILDVRSASNQPFEYENYSIIYNGEVYNFNELKEIYFFPSNRWDILTKDNVLIRLPEKDLLKSLNLAHKVMTDKQFKDNKLIDLRVINNLIIE